MKILIVDDGYAMRPVIHRSLPQTGISRIEIDGIGNGNCESLCFLSKPYLLDSYLMLRKIIA